MPKTSSVRIFSECQNSGQQWISFWTFVSSQAKCNSQNCLNFSQASFKTFSQIFWSIGVFQVHKFLRRNDFFFNPHNLLEIIKQHTKFPNCQNVFKPPGKHFSGIFQNAQFFGAAWEKIHKFPQPFNSLEHPSKWTVQWRVDYPSSNYFFCPLCQKGTGVSLLLIF